MRDKLFGYNLRFDVKEKTGEDKKCLNQLSVKPILNLS